MPWICFPDTKDIMVFSAQSENTHHKIKKNQATVLPHTAIPVTKLQSSITQA